MSGFPQDPVTAPTVEPITLQEVLDHLAGEGTIPDTDHELLNRYIEAARRYGERRQSRFYITQTWDYFLDRFPTGGLADFGRTAISIPRWPVQSVTSVKYTKSDDTQGTVTATDYVVDVVSSPPQIVLKDGKAWPSDTLRVVNGVEVRFVGGYGAAGDAVPATIRQAVLFLAAHFYQHREPVGSGLVATNVPYTLEAMFDLDDSVFVYA